MVRLARVNEHALWRKKHVRNNRHSLAASHDQMSPEILITDDAERLAADAADHIVQTAATAVARAGRFTLVLSGGRTPEKTYELLAAPPRRDAIDWATTYLFFGDERFVPHDDPRSNYALARRSLLDKVPIPPAHVFAISTDGATPSADAEQYATQLGEFFQVPLAGLPPAFDLVLLGLGDDGHTASLFPGAAALNEQQAWVTSSPPGTLPPPVDRITLTFPLLNAARQVLFLVSGDGKSAPVRDVLGGHAAVNVRPAAGVQPAAGTVTWLLDRAAAKFI